MERDFVLDLDQDEDQEEVQVQDQVQVRKLGTDPGYFVLPTPSSQSPVPNPQPPTPNPQIQAIMRLNAERALDKLVFAVPSFP
jgi:hypothetical protein